MSEPTRWIVSDDVPEELKELLGEASAPGSLPVATRRRVGIRVAGMVPVTVTVLGMSLKAVAATFAASVVVSGAALVAVQEFTEEEAPPRTSTVVEQRVPKAPKAQATALDPRPQDPAGAPEAEPESAIPTERFELPQRSAPTVGARRGGESAVPSAAPLKDRLAREAALLERARASLQASPASALAGVREHARDFPDGQLRAERMFIEAQALKNLGRHAEARHKAERALAQYPKGLYAERVQRFLHELP
jgi:hypothetical protein